MNHFNKAPPQALACGGALFLHRISLLLRMAPERIGTFSPFSNPFPPCLFHAAFFPICALFANMWTFQEDPFIRIGHPSPKAKRQLVPHSAWNQLALSYMDTTTIVLYNSGQQTHPRFKPQARRKPGAGPFCPANAPPVFRRKLGAGRCY